MWWWDIGGGGGSGHVGWWVMVRGGVEKDLEKFEVL